MKYYLSVVAIAKDESEYINEFIEYYKLLGVDHFYIYDNDSAVPLSKTLQKHRAYVTVDTITGKSKQMDAYRHYLYNYGHDSRWAAFIDLDEFIVPKTKYKLSDFLKGYEHADGFGINWMIYGDDNHQVKPTGLVTENYTRREVNQNIHIKSIVYPNKVQEPESPHFFKLKPGSTYIDARNNPINGPFNQNPSIDLIQINHYYTKSVEEFVKKAERGRADNGEKRDVKTEFEPHRLVWNEYQDTFLIDTYMTDLKAAITATDQKPLAGAETSLFQRLGNLIKGKK